MAVPATPAVAAFLWRARGAGIEVYLVRRAPSVRFFGGFWSIPGGAVEPEDDGDIAACAREVREETGLELGRDPARFVDAGRWITPSFSPIRFDARYFLVQVPDDAAPDHTVSPEHTEGMWLSPAEAMARWADGELLVPFPVARVIRALIPGIDGARERCAFEAEEEARSPRIWELADGIAQAPLRTPTLPPATHTNCWVIGAGDCVVIDPATPYDDERRALDLALDHWAARGRTVREVWLTHHHPDHVGAARYVAERLGVPIAAHRVTADLVAPALRVDRFIEDGDVVDLAGSPPRRLRAVFTPGHAPGHLCFYEEVTGMLVAGDMVASIGTIVVDPDEGDMQEYLDSLARMKTLGCSALLPAHGAAIADADAKIDEYVRHRLWREQRVLDALTARGRATAAELVPPVYEDVPQALFPLAERSLVAHLDKLVKDGRARRDGNAWMV